MIAAINSPFYNDPSAAHPRHPSLDPVEFFASLLSCYNASSPLPDQIPSYRALIMNKEYNPVCR